MSQCAANYRRAPPITPAHDVTLVTGLAYFAAHLFRVKSGHFPPGFHFESRARLRERKVRVLRRHHEISHGLPLAWAGLRMRMPGYSGRIEMHRSKNSSGLIVQRSDLHISSLVRESRGNSTNLD
jgi:hypothetical protein